MTFGIEIKDNKALALVKQLEELNILRLFPLKSDFPVEMEKIASNEINLSSVADLYGSIPYDEKRYKEQMQFIHEIRNEWE